MKSPDTAADTEFPGQIHVSSLISEIHALGLNIVLHTRGLLGGL